MSFQFAAIRSETFNNFENAIDRTLEIDKTKKDIPYDEKNGSMFVIPDFENNQLVFSIRNNKYIPTMAATKQFFARLKTHLSTEYLQETGISTLSIDNLDFALQKIKNKKLTFRTEGDIIRAVVGKNYAAYNNFALLTTLKNHTDLPVAGNVFIHMSDYIMYISLLSPYKLSSNVGDVTEFGLSATNSESGKSSVRINYAVHHKSANRNGYGIVIPTGEIISGAMRHVGEIQKINNYVTNVSTLVYKNIDDIKERWRKLPDKILHENEMHRAFFFLSKIVGQKLTEQITDENSGILMFKNKRPVITKISAYSFINSIMASIYDEVTDQETRHHLESYAGSFI